MDPFNPWSAYRQHPAPVYRPQVMRPQPTYRPQQGLAGLAPPGNYMPNDPVQTPGYQQPYAPQEPGALQGNQPGYNTGIVPPGFQQKVPGHMGFGDANHFPQMPMQRPGQGLLSLMQGPRPFMQGWRPRPQM